jgi:hypothetical protein
MALGIFAHPKVGIGHGKGLADLAQVEDAVEEDNCKLDSLGRLEPFGICPNRIPAQVGIEPEHRQRHNPPQWQNCSLGTNHLVKMGKEDLPFPPHPP